MILKAQNLILFILFLFQRDFQVALVQWACVEEVAGAYRWEAPRGYHLECLRPENFHRESMKGKTGERKLPNQLLNTVTGFPL